MSKRKTVLKFAIAIFFLGGSIAVAVLYFPYVALAIKFGVVVSAAPIVVFPISAMVALASVITLGVLAVSAMRSNDKSNEVDEKLRNEDEEKSLVQEEEQAIPAPAAPLLPQVAEELTSPTQQQPVGDSAEGTEIPQHEEEVNFVNNGDSAEQKAEQTKGSLPSLPPYPEQTFPVNNLESLPFPSLPSIVAGAHNSSGGVSNSVKDSSRQARVKASWNALKNRSYMDLSRYSAQEFSLPTRARSCPDLRNLSLDDEVKAFKFYKESRYGSGDESNQDHRSQTSVKVFRDDFDSDSYFSSIAPSSGTSLNNVHDIIRYRQDHHNESGLSSSIPDSMIAGSLNISFQRNHQQRVVRSNLPGYDVNNRNFDSINTNSVVGESVDTFFQDLQVNHRGQLEENYPGFAMTSGGVRLY